LRYFPRILLFCFLSSSVVQVLAQETVPHETDLHLATNAHKLFETYCFDCHDGSAKEGGLDLSQLLEKERFDGTLVFENVITARMPPKDAEQPTSAEKRIILEWLSNRQAENSLLIGGLVGTSSFTASTICSGRSWMLSGRSRTTAVRMLSIRTAGSC
jgi:hypothetical protein